MDNLTIIPKNINQVPISSALSATGRLVETTNLDASKRISNQLFNRAKKGARGKAATKIEMNPNCITKFKN